MPEYIVFVMPPYEPYMGAEPFDIPEWDFDAAMATANRYRERGWEACIIGYGTPFVPWRAGSLDGPDIRAMARTRHQLRLHQFPEDGLTMRGLVYTALTVVGIAATAAAAAYAFADRGYLAVGGEYAFLSLPLLGMCIGYIIDDMREGRHDSVDR